MLIFQYNDKVNSYRFKYVFEYTIISRSAFKKRYSYFTYEVENEATNL